MIAMAAEKIRTKPDKKTSLFFVLRLFMLSAGPTWSPGPF